MRGVVILFFTVIGAIIGYAVPSFLMWVGALIGFVVGFVIAFGAGGSSSDGIDFDFGD